MLNTTNPADTLHVVTVGQASATIPAGQRKNGHDHAQPDRQAILPSAAHSETTLTVIQSAERVASKIVWFRPT